MDRGAGFRCQADGASVRGALTRKGPKLPATSIALVSDFLEPGFAPTLVQLCPAAKKCQRPQPRTVGLDFASLVIRQILASTGVRQVGRQAKGKEAG